MENNYKEVYFDNYCENCEFEKLSEDKKPCTECLTNAINLCSHKPVKWKEKVK